MFFGSAAWHAASSLAFLREARVAIPEIIGSSRSTYTRVACMVCEEKGIEYVLTERPLRAPEILAIHPFDKMPVLRHGDVELFESKTIATYLDRVFPAPFVFPTDPHFSALTEQWVSLVNTVIDPILIRTYLFAYIAPKTADGKPDRGGRSEPSCRRSANSSAFSTRRLPAAAISSATSSLSPIST
ncbi:MAG: glutathione S-transferase N-terminal domain-containing protein [Reyranella sp.]|nr:glutathione S-transferase N-terminal domain-containing protein [Reyranella sp.]